jgi:hypothetical protein
MKYLRSSMILSGLLVVAGCTATTEETTFLQNVAIPNTPSDASAIPGISVDAKQRFVWAPRRRGTTTASDGTVTTTERRILCAEPSPDALSALSSAFRFKGNVETQKIGVGAELDKSFKEAVTNIGKRTVTIQLLRDGFYRACEAYANGLLEEFGYGLILNQIDNLMVKLVALETLSEGAAAASPEGQAKLSAVLTGRIELARAKADSAIAGERLRILESREKQDNDAFQKADGEATRLATEKRDQETLLADEKNIGDADKDKTKIQSLEQKIIGLNSRLAAANLNKDNAETTLKASTASVIAARTKNGEKEDLEKTASAKLATAIAQAASVKKIFPAGTADAVLKIVTDRGSGNTVKGACMMWFASNKNLTATVSQFSAKSSSLPLPIIAHLCLARLARDK